ncbi:phosphoribosylaminoimidazole-succinocarboxamide synthase [Peptoclostridium litorale DSM 5388]|uniref:Phosphoribosylaminoimidazole-succinocarboxamide synthase n=2 Tax=Peptoclostridium litorale TaxID=1557 RepID=A0A069RJF4_PEPLI|nr:phosphoribosylaminoimidazolesuccinocarboxamide synthase [Peptoclostridium litorale]KDR94392.1 phosphoribosylaminoimidazole-succinocarboxamide synthase PurC [Peptoclostridium litorale DSM 5388]SIO24641.1 phosphoribosylaminoimidazole-succinocarboxamide synthase [Peptoclostridium litorale DSM 5388]
MKKELLYEGKAKQVYKTENPKEYVVYYKDDATAFNGVKKDTIMEKGMINNSISSILFELLAKEGISSHFIKKLSDREMLVKAVEIVPLEVIVRNISAGSMSKRLGIEEGIVFSEPIFELCYKNDDLGDPLINDDHAVAIGLATREEIKAIKEQTLKINEVMKAFFEKAGLRLVDFKLEFGRYDGEVILSDEISPDTCRLWDMSTNEKMDKDRFRRDLGDVIESYKKVLERIEDK